MQRLSKAALQAALTQSQKQISDLTEKYDRLLGEYDRLLDKYADLKGEHADLKSEYADLKARHTESEHRLNKNSRNSHMPPSKDGLAKPKASGKKATSDLPSGGQPGHTGHTISRSDHVDHIEDHHPTVCLSTYHT